jgi:uncharacterized integral membrane protein
MSRRVFWVLLVLGLLLLLLAAVLLTQALSPVEFQRLQATVAPTLLAPPGVAP